MGLLMRDEREAVVAYGRMLLEHRLTRGTSGNLSVMDRDRRLFAMSPSGMDPFEVDIEDVVVMDLTGKVVQGSRRPSSEWDMHRTLYVDREDISAVVHTHSTFATALACTREARTGAVRPVHYLAALAGPELRCVPYHPFGSEKLAKAACVAMRGHRAVLLGNHGLLAAGGSIEQAFSIALEIEFSCEVYCHARSMGTLAPLFDTEMRDAAKRFESYGQR